MLAVARRTEADAVILDLMLQGGSGLPLIAELSAALPSLRIIVFSGIAFSEDVAREAKRRGAAAFVTKGADFEVLLDAVRRGSQVSLSRPASGLTAVSACRDTGSWTRRRVPFDVPLSPFLIGGHLMALWKDTNAGTATPSAGASPAFGSTPSPAAPPEKSNVAPLTPEVPRRAAKEQRLDMKESVIASDLTIEGKIVGSGHVRIAGRFKGDVQVDGNVTLDTGAHLEGQVKASVVVVGGELVGNIENAKRVELLEAA